MGRVRYRLWQAATIPPGLLFAAISGAILACLWVAYVLTGPHDEAELPKR